MWAPVPKTLGRLEQNLVHKSVPTLYAYMQNFTFTTTMLYMHNVQYTTALWSVVKVAWDATGRRPHLKYMVECVLPCQVYQRTHGDGNGNA